MNSDTVINEIEDRYPGIWEVSNLVFESAESVQSLLKINLNNHAELMGSALFARSISTYKSLLILSSHGLRDQGMVVLRVLIECMFYLVAISNENEFAVEYTKYEEHQRKRVLSKLARYKESVDKNDSDAKIARDAIKEIENEIKTEGIKSFSTEQVAMKANLHSWYDTLYSYTSTYVHVSARSLESHFVSDENNELIEYRNDPIVEDIDHLICPGADAAINCILAVCNIFRIAEPEGINGLRDRLKKHYGYA